MISVNASFYKEINGRYPRKMDRGSWIFEDMEGLWRHCHTGLYEDAKLAACASYRYHLKTSYGEIQVLP